MLFRTVESIIARRSVNLYLMTAFHPSSKRQVAEQTLCMLKSPSLSRLLIAAAPVEWDDLKSSLLTSFLFFLPLAVPWGWTYRPIPGFGKAES